MVHSRCRRPSQPALVKLSQDDQRDKLVAPVTSPPSTLGSVRTCSQRPESRTRVDNGGAPTLRFGQRLSGRVYGLLAITPALPSLRLQSRVHDDQTASPS